MPSRNARKRRHPLRSLGPGLVAGASDDDPAGIGTYSQAGAAHGFGLLWTFLVLYPLTIAVQETCARIARVTGRGLAANLARRLPRPVVVTLVLLLAAVNMINVGADLLIMGAATTLLVPAGVPAALYATGFGLGSFALEFWIPYHRYARALRWLTLVLFAYVATLFVVDVPWADVARAVALPRVDGQPGAWAMLIAVFGTTVAPYMFFWQASEEAEELHQFPGRKPLRLAPRQAPAAVARIRLDTAVGMGFSNLVAFCIMLAVAVTLHRAGVEDVGSAEDAAAALRPLAGDLAFMLFALGIVGTGLLAVPVLAGSAAYAVSEVSGWAASLERRPAQAKAFYALIAAFFAAGMALAWLPFDPIDALVMSAVLNGLVATVLLPVLVWMGSDETTMGPQVVSRWIRVGGWVTAAAMLMATLGLFLTIGR